MAELASSFATTIFDLSFGTIVRQFGYLWNHKKNIINLKSEVEKLDCVIEDISSAVTAAERNAQIVRRQVNHWQNNAEEIGVSATEIIGKYEEDAKKRCLIGLCPNLVSLYRGSRKAIKKQIEIVQVRTKAAQFNTVADRAVRQVPATPSTKGYLTFDSRNSILEEIVKAMKEDTVNSIGVYGLGGMGKTTLAKQVASRAAEEKMFEDVVMAPVTQTPKLEEIQGEIAKSLDLKLEGSSVAERAGNISKRMKEKKILVILDDLWGKLNLEEVGIPFGPDHKGCKLLFTSRSRDVLFSMGTNKDFNLEALGENEAWSLFAEKTVDVIKDPALLSVGKEVAKECAGLPVLIVTVAASLSSRPSLPAWKDALKELKRMNNKEVHEIVNSALEFISYKHLQKTHKQLFLLCGLCGSGFVISDLLKYSWGWNFFDEDVVTLEDARNKLHALILDLKASCLLLDGDDEDIIEIHDVVRGVAISLARKDQNMLCVGDGDTESIKWPNDDVLRSCTAMFFDGCRDFSRLPQRLECPLLEFFYLRRISLDAPSTISNTFFEKTRELKVLDMTNICFSGLPSSLSCLENLQTLCLDYCSNLEDISMIKELKRLQVLSFIGADIKELPRGIGQLSELRLLDLTNCSELKIIPAGLLAALSNLEELYMRRSFNEWEARVFHSSNGESSSNVSLSELNHLPKLHSLEIEVEDAKLLPQDYNFERLERYRIIAGHMYFFAEEFYEKGISRKLGLGMDLHTSGINDLPNGVKGFLKRTECLCLWKLKGIKNIVHELDRDGLPELKYLSIRWDYEIQFIVNVELKQQRAFPALESLYLEGLWNLEKICNGQLMQDSFGKLISVVVQDCSKLESLFSFSMAIGLPCLQELRVSNCSILKGIVAKKSGDEKYSDAISEKIEFGQLRKLSLERLPQLRSFYCSVKEKQKYMKTDAKSEEMVSEEEEPSSAMSLFKEVNFSSLESLEIYELDSINSIWHNQASEEDSCYKLEAVEVGKCAKLLKIFPSAMLNNFQSVKKVRIVDCQALEEVFEVQEGLNMKKITYDITTVLREVDVQECESLKSVFPACVAQRLHQLETLSIKDCMEVETIVEEENDGDDENKEVSVSPPTFTFPKLTGLYLSDLPKVECFYPKKHALEWPLLEELEVTDCDQICILELLHFSENQQHNQFQKELSKLESVTIRGKDMKMMTRQHSELFPNLTELTITGYDGDESAAIPSNFLYGLDNLKQLYIGNSSLGEIFPYEEGKQILSPSLPPLLPNLTHLYIYKLPELKYMICTQNSPFCPILNQLQWLWVEECPCLTNLVPTGSLSFKFLRDLTVKDCGGLIYLIPSSTAASLHQLERLTISGCPTMEEIVAADDSQEDHQIITFSKLRSLELEKLPKLTSFCTANNYTFNFPQLREVTVTKCPNMRSFSPGITITPMLQGVSFEEDAELWKDDLNTFNFPQLGYVKVRDCPNMMSFSPGITITPMLHTVSIEGTWHWKGDLNTTIQHHFSQMETQRLTAADPTTSEPQPQIHDNTTEIEEINEEGQTSEPREEVRTCGDATKPSGKGKGKIEISEEDPNHQDQASSSYTSTIPFYEQSSVPTEQQSEKSQETVPEEPTNAVSLAPVTNVVASSSLLTPTSNRPQTSPSLVTEAGTSKAGSNPQQNDLQISHFTQELVTLQSEEQFQETKRLTTTDPSNNHSEPEAKQIESACKEDGVGELRKKAEIPEHVMKPENEAEVHEHVVEKREGAGFLEKCNEPRNGTDICEEVIEEEKLADSCEKGERKEVETESQNSEEHWNGDLNTTVQHLYSVMEVQKLTTNDPKLGTESRDHEVTERGKEADTSERGKGKELEVLDEEAMKPPHSPSLVVEEGTSRSASNSQPKDVQILRVTEELITLLSEFQTLQTQPLKSMSAQQVQFVEDGFRDLSNMNFSIEWFLPYTEKAREYLSAVEQRKETSELELKIAEIKAQLQALEENMKALEDKDKAFGNIDLDKSLHDH